MRLKAFRVQKYKTIRDTGWVSIRTDVASLIGVNEAGKSSVLQALWKFNNVAGVSYDMLFDYPRDLYSRERETGKNHQVVNLEFTLDDSDRSIFAGEVGTEPERIIVAMTYAGTKTCWVKMPLSASGTAAIDALKKEIDGIERKQKPKADKVKAEAAKSAIAEFEAMVSDWGDSAKVSVAVERLRGDLANLESLIDAEVSASGLVALSDHAAAYSKAKEWILKRLPTFIYFEEYGTLQTKIHLPDFVKKKQAKSTEALVRTQVALFEWAQVSPDEILKLGASKAEGEAQEAVQRRKEERSTLLESASYHLTGDWIEWWDERNHELVIEADGEDLVLKVSDDKNPWKVPFQERSKGFQWFFSFYLTFLVESRKAHHGAILLLDEPGLHLHIRAQQKLLGFFQRVSKDNQLFYSTHSPFMVDPDHLDNVRTVYLAEDPTTKRSHTKVSPGTEPEGDADTFLPLQAAFGYELAQTLFIRKKILIVEGITDYWLLKTTSSLLGAAGRPSLPDDVAVLFAGGTSHIVPLVSLFVRPDRQDQRLVILLDADKAGLNKATQVRRDMLPGGNAVALMSDADLLGLANAEVEDILDRADLLAGLSSFKGRMFSLPATPEPTNVALIRQLYAAAGLGDFTHQEKASFILHLIDQWRVGAQQPSAKTLSQAEQVLRGIASRFK